MMGSRYGGLSTGMYRINRNIFLHMLIDNDISQRRLASVVGITPSKLCNAAYGKAIDEQSAALLADALNVPLEELAERI